MVNGWTDERRARQSRAIQRWKPWERSTLLLPGLEAGDVEARAEIMRRMLEGNIELFFRCLELASAETGDLKRL